jgi:hypothetical protein
MLNDSKASLKICGSSYKLMKDSGISFYYRNEEVSLLWSGTWRGNGQKDLRHLQGGLDRLGGHGFKSYLMNRLNNNFFIYLLYKLISYRLNYLP